MKHITLVSITLILSLSVAIAQKSKVSAALSLITNQSFETAKEKLDEAAVHEKTKDWPKTYYAYGVFYHELFKSDKEDLKGQYGNLLEEAYKNYKKSFELDSLNKLSNQVVDLNLYDFYNKLFTQGIDLFNAENYTDAGKLWEYAIDIRQYSTLMNITIDTSTMYNIAIAAMRGGDNDRAIEYFKKVTEYGYNGGNTYVLIKNSYLAKKDSVMAEKTLQEGFERYPEDQNVLIELINFYLTAGNSQNALDYLAVAKEKDPTNSSFYHAEGTLYDKMGDFDKSIASYNKAIELNPEFFDSYYNLGVLYFNKAVKIAEEANMTLDDKKYAKLKTEADVVFNQAVPLFEKCHELNPNDMSTMDNLKILYYRLKMTEKHDEMKAKIDAINGTTE